jgi:Txe/YoeB family toxin of Txe-Axe toxin-antitoxin module
VDYEIEYPTNYDELLAQEIEEISKLVDNNPQEVIKKSENLKRLLEEKELNKYNVSMLLY